MWESSKGTEGSWAPCPPEGDMAGEEGLKRSGNTGGWVHGAEGLGPPRRPVQGQIQFLRRNKNEQNLNGRDSWRGASLEQLPHPLAEMEGVKRKVTGQLLINFCKQFRVPIEIWKRTRYSYNFLSQNMIKLSSQVSAWGFIVFLFSSNCERR